MIEIISPPIFDDHPSMNEYKKINMIEEHKLPIYDYPLENEFEKIENIIEIDMHQKKLKDQKRANTLKLKYLMIKTVKYSFNHFLSMNFT